MTTHPASQELAPPGEPLVSFSQCHLGILSQLRAFEELPALQAATVQARTIATQTLSLFKDAVYEHHADEENELFPAVLSSAAKGEEADWARAMVQRLKGEHRKIEACWKMLAPSVKNVAKGRPGELDLRAVEELVHAYTAHARFEEEQFLPLAQTILGRNNNHMEALELSLHLRHTPQPVGHI